MKNNKKTILAIIFIFVVLILAGAAYYISNQLISRQAVAPTAPESKPAAAGCTTACPRSDGVLVNCEPPYSSNGTTESLCNSTGRIEPCGGQNYCCPVAGGQWTTDMTKCTTTLPEEWVGNTACTATGSATAVACVASGIINCSPDCPTACGTAASTITTCTDSCGKATTKSCAATANCKQVNLKTQKQAYKNEVSNTPGKYSLTTQIDTVSKSQIYVYAIILNNISDVLASDVVVTDSLKNLPITFMDADPECSYSATDVKVTCKTTINPGITKSVSFRVKASNDIVNGEVISNTISVSNQGVVLADLVNDLAVSSVVGCNHTCTASEECIAGLTCDTTTNKCRKAACLTNDNCICPTATPTRITTQQPTVTRDITTIAPTKDVTVAATPTILPETGILDLPGVAAFGGGLILAVVGILLAL